MTQPNLSHRIRLRKPWERYDETRQTLDDGGTAERDAPAASSEHRVDMPDLSLAPLPEPSVAGHPVYRATYLRRFHRPSGIEPGDKLQLEVGPVRGRIAAIRINSVVVSGDYGIEQNSGSTNRLDLNGRLADHNELKIELESTKQAPGPPRLVGDVNLWIITTH